MTYDKLKGVSAEEFLKERKVVVDGLSIDLLNEYAEIKCRELNELLDIQIEAYLSAGTNKKDLLALMTTHYEKKKTN